MRGEKSRTCALFNFFKNKIHKSEKIEGAEKESGETAETKENKEEFTVVFIFVALRHTPPLSLSHLTNGAFYIKSD